ncbi:hypothetical protein NDU88_005977 [Pleurodeles waltl]|uniref:Uncharacterized protein n=1 Tax=Pleurodeles waltl TaxID=8319 RepID=A0AAV7VMY3_PLEWA|nr:hypothetical protein NDU88_005977 [Pleurodeles waltl]
MKPPPPPYPKVTTLLLRGGGGPCCGWAAVLQPRWLPCLAIPQNPLLNPKSLVRQLPAVRERAVAAQYERGQERPVQRPVL